MSMDGMFPRFRPKARAPGEYRAPKQRSKRVFDVSDESGSSEDDGVQVEYQPRLKRGHFVPHPSMEDDGDSAMDGFVPHPHFAPNISTRMLAVGRERFDTYVDERDAGNEMAPFNLLGISPYINYESTAEIREVVSQATEDLQLAVYESPEFDSRLKVTALGLISEASANIRSILEALLKQGIAPEVDCSEANERKRQHRSQMQGMRY